MTKEELKKKCTERAKIFQKAMVSCHSSSPIDCIEWFADRIAELEDKLANADYQLEGRDLEIKDLEKENAELKTDNVEWEKASDKWKSVYELTNNQLTKAKEIIKKLLATPRSIYGRDEDGELTSFFNSDYEELKKHAEQFLNSEVEK